MIKLYKDFEQVQGAVHMAMKHRLYVARSDYCLKRWYEWVLEGDEQYGRSIAFYFEPKSDKPVAVALLDGFNRIQVYVKPSHRRKGIGTKLFNSLVNAYPWKISKKFFGSGGIHASSSPFWESLGFEA